MPNHRFAGRVGRPFSQKGEVMCEIVSSAAYACEREKLVVAFRGLLHDFCLNLGIVSPPPLSDGLIEDAIDEIVVFGMMVTPEEPARSLDVA